MSGLKRMIVDLRVAIVRALTLDTATAARVQSWAPGARCVAAVYGR